MASTKTSEYSTDLPKRIRAPFYWWQIDRSSTLRFLFLTESDDPKVAISIRSIALRDMIWKPIEVTISAYNKLVLVFTRPVLILKFVVISVPGYPQRKTRLSWQSIFTYPSGLQIFRKCIFPIVSTATTTGFTTTDYNQWTSFSQYALLFLMFVGGCAGSTAGGIKIVPHSKLASRVAPYLSMAQSHWRRSPPTHKCSAYSWQADDK